MRFCSLGSGSSGNSTLIEASNSGTTSRLLIDCGLALKQLEMRLAKHALCFKDIDAVFVTHEHSDHVGCARQLALQERFPMWMSRGTYAAMGSPDLAGQHRFARDDELLKVGVLAVLPLTVPHDAKEPLQLMVTDGDKRVGLLTDLGHATAHVLARAQNLDALILEFNHDPELLQASNYPPFLKKRITGGHGHLNNEQAAGLLKAILHKGLRHVVAAHLSEQNNHPELVCAALAPVVADFDCAVHIANAQSGFDWLQA